MKNIWSLKKLLKRLYVSYERANMIMTMAEVPQEIKKECKCENCKCKTN